MKIYELINKPSGIYGLGGVLLNPDDLLLIQDTTVEPVNVLTQDQIDAISNSNNPSESNPFATLDDIGTQIPPVAESYINQSAMIANQSGQTSNYIYYDGTSYWEYIGTTNGNISDYREIASPSQWINTTGGIYYPNAIGVGTSVLISGRSATFASDIQVNSLTVGRGNGNNISNAVLGDNALNANTSGFSNLALGQSALTKNTSGYINAGVGPQSLRETTTGIFNTSVGGSSMQNNVSGSWNSAVGGQAISDANSSFNSGVGGLSLSNLLTSSDHNIALGYRAGKYLTSIADLAGNFLTSSNQSVFLGSESMAGTNTIVNSIVIGYRAIGLGSNTTVIGNSSTTHGRWWGNLLIGTSTNSGFQLDINGVSRMRTSSGNYTPVLQVENTGSASIDFKNVALFVGARGNASDINDNTNIGIWQKNATNNNFGVFNFYNAVGNLSASFGTRFVNHGSFQIGDLIFATSNSNGFATRLTIYGNGNIVTGTSADAGFKLDVTGALRVQGNTTFTSVTSATGDIITIDANNVLRRQTVAEIGVQIGGGGGSKWTDVGSDIYRDSAVAIGRNTIPTNATFAVQSRTGTATNKYLQFLNNSGTELFSQTQAGSAQITGVLSVGTAPVTNITGLFRAQTDTNASVGLRVQNQSGTTLFTIDGNSTAQFPSTVVGIYTSPLSNFALTLRSQVAGGGIIWMLNASGTNVTQIQNDGSYRTSAGAYFGLLSAPSGRVNIRGTGTTTANTLLLEDSAGTDNVQFLDNGNIIYRDGSTWQLGATTGTKIGTATSQKIGFFNATPIVQPSGDILTALENLGLVNSPTISVSGSTGGVGGTGTTNYVTKFTNSTTLGNSQIFDNGTNVMVNTTTDNGSKFQVNGTGWFSSTVTASNFITTSDIRLKKNIEKIENALDTLSKFSSYEYLKNGEKDAGFIAQEVEKILPYAVYNNNNGYLTMSDRPILAYIHKAILELKEEIDNIKKKL
jgi:hypothetical protein